MIISTRSVAPCPCQTPDYCMAGHLPSCPLHAPSSLRSLTIVAIGAAWRALARLLPIVLLLIASCAVEVQPIDAVAEASCPESTPSTDRRVVLLKTAARGLCTAAVIGPRELLTAAHCVGHGDAELVLDDGSAVPTDTDGVDPDGADAARLYLPTYRFDVEPLEIATRAPAAGEWLALIGFGCTHARERRLLGVKDPAVEDRARLANLPQERMGTAFGCTCPGDSGAPLIDGEGKIAGVHFGWSGAGDELYSIASLAFGGSR